MPDAAADDDVSVVVDAAPTCVLNVFSKNGIVLVWAN
jgi:hypothetical protein